jgi:hypothetical protein
MAHRVLSCPVPTLIIELVLLILVKMVSIYPVRGEI